MAGNAPLAAIESLDQLDTHAAMQRDFVAVARRQAPAVTVAANWAGQDPKFTFDWLCRQVQDLVVTSSGVQRGQWPRGIQESVLERMDRRNMFCYLDRINRLRGKPKGTYRLQYVLEELLIDWASGLASDPDGVTGDMMMMSAERQIR